MQHRAAEHNNASRETPMMALPGVLQRACACGNHRAGGGECEGCSKTSKGMLQPKAFASNDVTEAPPVVHEVLNSPGQALNSETRAFMEPRFAHDFSSVRVHSDSKAAESARAVNALAYTVGRDMVFGAGQYAPATREGRKLIAHELTHVEQQSHISPLRNEPLRVSPSLSGEAEANSNAAVIDAAAPLRTGTQPSIHQIQRKPLAGVDDPIHGQLIEEWRKGQGLPPGGKDAEGNQVGPTDAEIKYGGLLTQNQESDNASGSTASSQTKPKKAGEKKPADKEKDEEGGLETKVNVIPFWLNIPFEEGKPESKQALTLEISYKLRPMGTISGKKVDYLFGQVEFGFEGGIASVARPLGSVTIPIAEAGLSLTVVEMKLKGHTGKLLRGLTVALGARFTGDLLNVKAEAKGQLRFEGKIFFLNVEGGREGVGIFFGKHFGLPRWFYR